jgi:hypothetical protein
LRAAAVDREHGVAAVDVRAHPHRPGEGARQQLVQHLVLEPLARPPAELAAFLLLDRRGAIGDRGVDHHRGQQLVLATHAHPQAVAAAVRQAGVVTTERRDETARGQLERTDRLGAAFVQPGVEVGEVEGSGEAEQGEVAEEHGWVGVLDG